MATLRVERSVWIDAPRERVWRAVTEPQELERWYAEGCAWEIPALAVGNTIWFHNTETEILTATIEVCDPPQQFTLRWEPDSQYPALSLITTFLVAAENGGSRMTISESGYEALPDDVRQPWMDQTSEGYFMSIDGLKAYLENATVTA